MANATLPCDTRNGWLAFTFILASRNLPTRTESAKCGSHHARGICLGMWLSRERRTVLIAMSRGDESSLSAYVS